MTNADQNLEPRVEAVEIDTQELRQSIAETNRNVSDLRSTVSTLADIVGIHEQLHEESRQRHEEFKERFERYIVQAEADRALMLQLIQAIAQGRNGEE